MLSTPRSGFETLSAGSARHPESARRCSGRCWGPNHHGATSLHLTFTSTTHTYFSLHLTFISSTHMYSSLRLIFVSSTHTHFSLHLTFTSSGPESSAVRRHDNVHGRCSGPIVSKVAIQRHVERHPAGTHPPCLQYLTCMTDSPSIFRFS